MQPVSVLFARRDSIYKTLGVDVWDIDRDARNFPGGNPVIAHPPCRAWGNLAHFAKPRPDEKQLSIFAISLIRKYGGILEHPATSKLWPTYLPLPGSSDAYEGYTICLDQFWFGHKARKRTLLYIVGCSEKSLPPIPLRFDAIQYTVCSPLRYGKGNHAKKAIKKSEREATPLEFARWLIASAGKCQVRTMCT